MADNDENVSLTDIETESQINSDLCETESRLMEGVTSQSTPTPVKKDDSNDIINMMKFLMEKQNIMISNKFEEVNSKFDKINDKVRKLDEKFETMTDKILESIDHGFDEQNARINDVIKMNKRDEKREGDRYRLEQNRGESKQVSGVDDNYEIKVGVESGEETEQLNGNKDDQVTYNTVSRGEKMMI